MSGATLRLDGELTIYRAAELKPLLLELLARPEPSLSVDLADASELDSAGVQLLVAACRSAAAAGRTLVLTGVGDLVRDTCRLLGADTLLPVDPAVAA